MTYRLVYTHRAARDIAALDPKTKERIGAQLVRYKEDPLRHPSGSSMPRSVSFASASAIIEWYSTWRGRKSSSSAWGTGGRSIDGNLPLEAT